MDNRRELKVVNITYNKQGFYLTMSQEDWAWVNRGNIAVKNSRSGIEKVFHFVEENEDVKTFKSDEGLILTVKVLVEKTSEICQ